MFVITVLQYNDRAQCIDGVIQTVACNEDELGKYVEEVKEQQANVSRQIGNDIRWEGEGVPSPALGEAGFSYEGWEYNAEDPDESWLVVVLDIRPASKP